MEITTNHEMVDSSKTDTKAATTVGDRIDHGKAISGTILHRSHPTSGSNPTQAALWTSSNSTEVQRRIPRHKQPKLEAGLIKNL